MCQQAFLVGIHFRMGDTTMSKELGRVSGANNDKRSQVSLSTYLIHVNNLLQVLTEVLRPLDVARPSRERSLQKSLWLLEEPP